MPRGPAGYGDAGDRHGSPGARALERSGADQAGARARRGLALLAQHPDVSEIEGHSIFSEAGFGSNSFRRILRRGTLPRSLQMVGQAELEKAQSRFPSVREGHGRRKPVRFRIPGSGFQIRGSRGFRHRASIIGSARFNSRASPSDAGAANPRDGTQGHRSRFSIEPWRSLPRCPGPPSR
jgi:hypothetical protein